MPDRADAITTGSLWWMNLRESVDSPHHRDDPDLSVSDPDVSAFPPAGAPAVLAEPGLLGVVVTDAADAVAAFRLCRRRLHVHAAGVGEEIGVDDEAGDERSFL